MRPDRITIMISGTLRGTDPLPHADNASTFYLSPGLLHGHRSSAVRGVSCIFSDGVGGIFASSLFGQPPAGQTELARGAAPSNPGPQYLIRRFVLWLKVSGPGLMACPSA